MPAFLATLLLPCAPSDREMVRSSDLAGFSEMIGFPSNTSYHILKLSEDEKVDSFYVFIQVDLFLDELINLFFPHPYLLFFVASVGGSVGWVNVGASRVSIVNLMSPPYVYVRPTYLAISFVVLLYMSAACRLSEQSCVLPLSSSPCPSKRGALTTGFLKARRFD
jgi:hypothetical protein